MAPDQAIWERDIAATPFVEGVARNRWALVSRDWPFALFNIIARDGRAFHLRLNFDGYPAASPTGGLWDPTTGAPPNQVQWPIGDAVFASVFNPSWQNGLALYLPLDRVSLNGHHDWPTQYPHLMWQPERGLVQYLGEVHRLLNARGYHGLPG